ncbi:MAG: glutathione S-transferase family protein [Myxococcota bacterium]|nr:glutathione S-transferase family protein [Myxococcota bacterium]
MGLLIDGVWSDAWYDTKKSKGQFVRDVSRFRNWITPDGSPGISGEGGFPAEAERYHLYVSHACPWAHRTLIFRRLKGLESMISVSVVHPLMLNDGWTFEDDFDGATGDALYGKRFLREIYQLSAPNVTGRVTVPVLWDKVRGCIVSNESSEIIRMFNSAFDELTGNTLDFWPLHHRADIASLNTKIYHTINNGVYKAGFATTTNAYEEAVRELFDALDWLEQHLQTRRYLLGDEITEADWRLFTTLIRFDAVYFGHFKCNIRPIKDYPCLFGYVRDLYQQDGIAPTVFMDHIKHHYYASHTMINPTQIVPLGPEIDFLAPHGRAELAAQ